MPRVVQRSASQAVKSGPSRRGVPLPQFVPFQLSQPVEKPPSGPQWVHEIKLDGYRMAARLDNGRVQLLTRTGLDWTAKYPSAIAALANVNVKTAYLDGELCGVDEAGLPSFAHTQAATDGERGVHLVYYAFDLLHPLRLGRLGPPARQAQRAARVAGGQQAWPAVQWPRYRGRRTHPEARGQARLRGRGLQGDRRALCARKSGSLAQSESAKSPGVCNRRLVGP